MLPAPVRHKTGRIAVVQGSPRLAGDVHSAAMRLLQRHKEIEISRDRDKDTHTHTYTSMQAGTQAGRQADRQANNRQTSMQTAGKHADKVEDFDY